MSTDADKIAAARREYDAAWAAICRSKRSISGCTPQALRWRAACRALREVSPTFKPREETAS